ncbi:MAG: hypothetical protein K2I54_00960, partial [Muribaculaceae bacterium]|nr:hypothetical protein [Muribaculaceae bacterium]
MKKPAKFRKTQKTEARTIALTLIVSSQQRMIVFTQSYIGVGILSGRGDNVSSMFHSAKGSLAGICRHDA